MARIVCLHNWVTNKRNFLGQLTKIRFYKISCCFRKDKWKIENIKGIQRYNEKSLFPPFCVILWILNYVCPQKNSTCEYIGNHISVSSGRDICLLTPNSRQLVSVRVLHWLLSLIKFAALCAEIRCRVASPFPPLLNPTHLCNWLINWPKHFNERQLVSVTFSGTSTRNEMHLPARDPESNLEIFARNGIGIIKIMCR